MQRTLATELRSAAGRDVRVSGWLHNVRELRGRTFAIVRDRSGLAQVVAEDPMARAVLAELQRESVICVRGRATASEQAPGGVEITSPVVDVIAAAATTPPVDLHRPTIRAQLPTLLDHAAVSLRHPRAQATFRLAAASMAGFRRTLDARGFTEIQTPKIVGSATESGANVFRLDYFGRPAFLAQSPQFYKQTMVGVFERVYEVGPVFRAEPHDTVRHLAEYVSLDAEIGFIQDHRDVMAVLRDVVAGMVESIRAQAAASVDLLGVDLPDVPASVPVVHFAEAQAMVAAATGEDVVGEPDLAPAHEQWLGDWAQREFGSDFLFVEGYPMRKRPFYTHPEPRRPEFSNSFDLIFRGMELATGGQRLHLHGDYLDALVARGESAAAYEGYLEAFRHGMPPHGGFAIGLERWVARLTRAANIRETTLFPRDLHRVAP